MATSPVWGSHRPTMNEVNPHMAEPHRKELRWVDPPPVRETTCRQCGDTIRWRGRSWGHVASPVEWTAEGLQEWVDPDA